MLAHVYVWSRNVLGLRHAYTCHARYIQSLNAVASEGLRCVIRLAVMHRHHRIIYHLHSTEGIHTLRVTFDLPKCEEIQVSNDFIFLGGNDHAHDIYTRHISCYVQCFICREAKHKQQTCVTLHSMDRKV